MSVGIAILIFLACLITTLISSEVLTTSTVFGAFALLVAYVLYREHRAALVQTIKLLALSYVGMVVLISPYLYFFLFGHQYPPGATKFEADLASFALLR